MKHVFADSVYWIGLADPHDQHHQEALRAEEELDNAIIVTTDSVFEEVFASLRGKHELRSAAINLLNEIRDHPNVEFVHQHVGLFNRAVARYGDRLDKTYSLVDCISMEVMDDYAITDVLTADRDFEREGYTRLMHNPNE